MKTKLSLLTIVILMIVVSCKKEKETVIPGNISSIQSLYDDFGAPSQTFTVNSEVFQVITGTKGIKLSIPANAFVTQNGQPVTGSVTIELREILSKKDMILSNAPTTSDKKILVSGGEAFINVTQGGNELKLATGKQIDVNFPAGNNPSYEMKKFYASTLTNNNDWQLGLNSSNTTDTTTIPLVVDSSGFSFFNYDFKSDSLKWINCDYFYADPNPTTDIFIEIDKNFDSQNCAVFIAFTDINSVTNLYAYKNHVFSYGANYIPEGKNVTFIVIGKVGDQYHAGFAPATISTNHSQKVILKPMSIQEIETELNKL